MAVAKEVACVVDGKAVGTTDLETGSCPFTIPESLPVNFDYKSQDNYKVDFYYAIAQNHRYFSDIENKGREISIPAKSLYGTDGAPLYHVHAEKSAPSNSTLKRDVYKRDGASDLANSLKTQDGTPEKGHKFEVVDLTDASGLTTETATSTLLVTITSCSDNKCVETAVPGKETVTTVTVNDEVTSYTTVCPLTEAAESTSTVLVTITSCENNKCFETAVPGKETVTTVTINDKVTSYTTVCPATEDVEETSTVLVTVTCTDDACTPETKAPESEAPATDLTTVTISDEVTTYTTVCPVSEAEAAQSTIYVTVTSCDGNKCGVTVVPASSVPVKPTGYSNSTVPATGAPVTSSPVTLAPATTAPATNAPATSAPEENVTSTVFATVHSTTVAANSVSTYEAGAAGVGMSLLAMVLIPLVGLF